MFHLFPVIQLHWPRFRLPWPIYKVKRFFCNLLRYIFEILVIIGLAAVMAAIWYVVMFIY